MKIRTLQAALDESYLENFIVTRGDKFFMDEQVNNSANGSSMK